MADGNAPYHAHIYYTETQRPAAREVRDLFARDPQILFTGRLADGPVGPHPMPQFEVHFLEPAVPEVVATIEASGLRALVHPLTDDDLADHTTFARWIGEPLELDVAVLDPPGRNKGVARFGNSDF